PSSIQLDDEGVTVLPQRRGATNGCTEAGMVRPPRLASGDMELTRWPERAPDDQRIPPKNWAAASCTLDLWVVKAPANPSAVPRLEGPRPWMLSARPRPRFSTLITKLTSRFRARCGLTAAPVPI